MLYEAERQRERQRGEERKSGREGERGREREGIQGKTREEEVVINLVFEFISPAGCKLPAGGMRAGYTLAQQAGLARSGAMSISKMCPNPNCSEWPD